MGLVAVGNEGHRLGFTGGALLLLSKVLGKGVGELSFKGGELVLLLLRVIGKGVGC